MPLHLSNINIRCNQQLKQSDLNMPYKIIPDVDCKKCVHRCVSYIREQSKRMKDRDTQYRLAQKLSMACTYDSFVPGFDHIGLGSTPLIELAAKCVTNGMCAGKFLEKVIPSHFGENVETSFALTSGQVGKVQGDVYEMLSRSILWNSSLYLSNLYNEDESISYAAMQILGSKIANNNNDFHYLPITLGDNYDLKKLFSPYAKNLFTTFEKSLENKGTSFCYSTPDLVVIKIKKNTLPQELITPIKNISIYNQDLLSTAREYIQGKIEPEDIILAAGIKTSIRSDRMYQLLFEANAWKAIWRAIYDIEPSQYHGLIGQSYGANPKKLNSIEFTSLGKNNDNYSKAIDQLTLVSTPFDLMAWFANSITKK